MRTCQKKWWGLGFLILALLMSVNYVRAEQEDLKKKPEDYGPIYAVVDEPRRVLTGEGVQCRELKDGNVWCYSVKREENQAKRSEENV